MYRERWIPGTMRWNPRLIHNPYPLFVRGYWGDFLAAAQHTVTVMEYLPINRSVQGQIIRAVLIAIVHIIRQAGVIWKSTYGMELQT